MSDPQTQAAGNGTAGRPLLIAGIHFMVEDQYSDGDTINAAEAHTLNQTRRENLRNNFANKVDSEKEKAQKEGRSVDMQALQAEFSKYAEEYEFGVRGSGGAKSDPLTTEMRRLARDAIREQIKAKGHKLSSVAPEKMNELIEGALVKYSAQLKAKAEAVIAARSGSLGDLEIAV